MPDSLVKDPDSAGEVFTFVWCTLSDGTNDGTASDTGDLQSETTTAQMPSGITLDSENTNETTIQGVTYTAATVHNVVLSGGTDGTKYTIVSRIVTSGSRTLDKTMTIVCRET
jgi:hypothetical protein